MTAAGDKSSRIRVIPPAVGAARRAFLSGRERARNSSSRGGRTDGCHLRISRPDVTWPVCRLLFNNAGGPPPPPPPPGGKSREDDWQAITVIANCSAFMRNLLLLLLLLGFFFPAAPYFVSEAGLLDPAAICLQHLHGCLSAFVLIFCLACLTGATNPN